MHASAKNVGRSNGRLRPRRNHSTIPSETLTTSKIKIVSFDEANAVLQGIIDGQVHGTVSQQPYYYGYESVRILAKLSSGDKSAIPAGGFHEVSSVEVRKANVEKFWADLKKMQEPGK